MTDATAALMTPWRLLPAYAVNGIEVALGITAVHLLASAVFGAQTAPLVVSGAVCASIADLPNTVVRSWHRVGAAALLAAVTVLAVDLLRPHPAALGAAVMAVTFVAMMTLAWGPRAGAVSFAPILAMIFSMAVPASARPVAGAFAHAAYSACGSLAFLGWALLANAACQRRYRSLALANALRAAADLFSARAAVLGAATPRAGAADGNAPMGAWISGEAVLAERLQTARDLLFAARPGARAQRDVALLLRVIDLRDVLLASRLDADLWADGGAGSALLQHIAGAFRDIGGALAAAADHVQHGTQPRGAPVALGDALPDVLAAALTTAVHHTHDAAGSLPPGDARARLLPSLAGRLQQLRDDLARVERLLRGGHETLPLTHAQLQQFVAAEGWPLRALRAHTTLDSPVLRHALRTSLALGVAYFLALALPWGAHPYWLILSVAVVLRGNLGDTLSRRNARVLGTVLGCLVVVGLSQWLQAGLLGALFIVAVGVAHAFVLQRYWLTATAASVMALLQSHLVNPGSGFAVTERLADTLLGALIAWSFSYVLPSWEQRSVPQGITRVLRELAAYAAQTLQPAPDDAVAQRLARRQAYDALSAMAAALQRSRVEPKGVRLPAPQLSALLDHGERLMAHLSMVQLTRARLLHAGAGAADAAAVVLAKAADEVQRWLTGAVESPAQTAAAPATAGAAKMPDGTPDLSSDLLPDPLPDRLPEQTLAQDLLPWLARRLRLLGQEARQVRQAAEAAQAALDGRGARDERGARSEPGKRDSSDSSNSRAKRDTRG